MTEKKDSSEDYSVIESPEQAIYDITKKRPL